MSYRDTIAELDALSRQRALTAQESRRLEIALQYEARGLPRKRYWQASEDRCAIELRLAGRSYGSISREISRTPDAVASRLRFLGYRGVSSRDGAAG